jgi:hypothetical protein
MSPPPLPPQPVTANARPRPEGDADHAPVAPGRVEGAPRLPGHAVPDRRRRVGAAHRRHPLRAARGHAPDRRSPPAVLQLRGRPDDGEPADQRRRDLERPERPGMVGAAVQRRRLERRARRLRGAARDVLGRRARGACQRERDLGGRFRGVGDPRRVHSRLQPAGNLDLEGRRGVPSERPHEADLRHPRLHPARPRGRPSVRGRGTRIPPGSRSATTTRLSVR